MVGKLRDQPPLLLRELRSQGPPPRRLAILSHRGKLERKDPSKLVLGLGVAREESIGALNQHTAGLYRLHRQAKYPVASMDHLRPHVVEEIGKEGQSAGVFRRLLRASFGDIVRKTIGLEPRGENLGEARHDLAQFRLAQRWYVDLAMRFIKRFVALQVAKKVRAQAHEGPKTLIGKTLREHFREAAALALLGAQVELFALIDIEHERRRLRLTVLLQSILGGVEEPAQRSRSKGLRPTRFGAPRGVGRWGRTATPAGTIRPAP
jgi:hypothetical protein